MSSSWSDLWTVGVACFEDLISPAFFLFSWNEKGYREFCGHVSRDFIRRHCCTKTNDSPLNVIRDRLTSSHCGETVSSSKNQLCLLITSPINRTRSYKPWKARVAWWCQCRQTPTPVSRGLPPYWCFFNLKLRRCLCLCLCSSPSFFFFFVYFRSKVPLLISRLACCSIHTMIGLSFTPNHSWYIQLVSPFTYNS